MSGFHTIVVALDFSDSTHDALDAALALAATDPGSQVHLLHVVPSAVTAGASSRQRSVVQKTDSWLTSRNQSTSV